MDIYYGLEFREEAPKNDKDHAWFKVGKILEFQSEDAFYKRRQQLRNELPKDATIKSLELFERNLERLYHAVWKKEVINFYTEKEQGYERVLDIFVRANQGGTRLTLSDLLLSMVTLKWGGVPAREAIYDFVDRLNSQLTGWNDFDKDFVLKACLAVTGLPLKYEVKNFTSANLAKIESQWDSIKLAIESGIDLVNTFGIDKENLTSQNALIPLIYFLYQRQGINLRDNSAYSVRNAAILRRWLVSSLLNNVFGGSSDTMLEAIRDVLKEHAAKDCDFPLKPLADTIAKRGRIPSLAEDTALENVLSITYRERRSFLALSVLFDEAPWGTLKYHQDHIFPSDCFKKNNLEKQGFKGDDVDRLIELKDCLGNLTLLLGQENVEKSNQPFDKWLATRDPTFTKKHLIPCDPGLYSLKRFEDFVRAREDLIKARLKALYAVAP